MESSDFNNIVANFPTTHNFRYKEQSFPFNMVQFNCFTDYFTKHPDAIQSDNTISLLDNDNDANIPSNDSINAFIQFCQFQKIQINNDNVLAINYLSKKYNVQKLINYTASYISLHQKELSLQYLSLYHNLQDSDRSQSEEAIAQNLVEIIDDDMLLQLPVPTLYRIFKKYQNYKPENISIENDQKVLNFLFKCLEKHGKSASSLFSFVDFKSTNSDCINRLLSEFSDIFDFHFINPLFLKNIYDYQNEIIKNFEKMKVQEDQMMKNLVEEHKNLTEEIRKMREENQTILREMNSLKEENKKIREELDILNNCAVKAQFFLYDSNQQNTFHGIIHYLTKLCGGNVKDKSIVNVTSSSEYNSDYLNKYAVDLEDKSHFFASDDEANSWLKYDFKDKKVRPTHYSIRTRHGKGPQNPKTWVIEGSNDDSEWKQLDKRTDEKCLDGNNLEHTFDIQTKLAGNEFFRYLRIKQTGLSTDDDNMFALSALEYFGYFL